MEPIDRQDHFELGKCAAQRLCFTLGVRLCRRGGKLLKINPHWKSVHLDHMVGCQELGHMMLIAEDAQDALEKMVRVLVRVESNQVGPQQTLQNLTPPFSRQKTKHLKRGEWDVQEKPDRYLWPPSFEQPRQQHQVIIVNPQDVIGPYDVFQRITKDSINLLVLLPKVRLIFGKSRKIMKQRPDRRVAKSKIELLHLFFAEKHRVRLKRTERLSDQLPLERNLDGASRPANPKMLHTQRRRSPAGLHERRQTCDQAAGALV